MRNDAGESLRTNLDWPFQMRAEMMRDHVLTDNIIYLLQKHPDVAMSVVSYLAQAARDKKAEKA